MHLCGPGMLTAWLSRHDPDLLRERMAFAKRPVKSWDRLFVRGSTVLFVALFLLAGLDAARYDWSRLPRGTPGPRLAGLGARLRAFLPGHACQPLLVPRRGDPPGAGQRVVTSGPYRVVCHPMYVGAIWFCLYPAGARVAVGAGAGRWIVGLFCVRTAPEDRALHGELPGYVEYARRTPYRLIPGAY